MSIENFLPVQTLDIEAENQVSFDLYLNLPLNGRVILYKRKGGQLEGERLSSLTGSNLTHFWVRREEYHEFVRYMALRFKKLLDVPEGRKEKSMMATAAQAILSSTVNAQDSAVMKMFMNNLNEISNHLIGSVLGDISSVRKQAYLKFIQIAERGSDFHKHPINVSSLSVLIALGVGYSTSKILSEVAIGGLLHDIGLAKLPSRIATHEHEPDMLSDSERADLYRHGELGLEILNERKIQISEIAQAIITQHHEKFSGFGYPARRRGYVINEFAQIVQVADELDYVIRYCEGRAESLRSQVSFLFSELESEKAIEPSLLARIRPLFIR